MTLNQDVYSIEYWSNYWKSLLSPEDQEAIKGTFFDYYDFVDFAEWHRGQMSKWSLTRIDNERV